MSRVEQRREERKIKKLSKWLNGLNRDQKALLAEYCKEKSREDLIVYMNAMETVLRPYIYSHSMDELIGENMLDGILGQIALEGEKIHEFLIKGDSYMKKIDEAKPQIVAKYDELIQKGWAEKEVMKELKDTFTSLTANAIKNVVAEHKREKRKKAQELNSNSSTEDLASYIIGDTPKEHSEIKPATPEQVEEVKSIKKEQETSEAVQAAIEKAVDSEHKVNGRFKIKNKTVIVDVIGEHGEYHVENGKVKRANESLVYNDKDHVVSELKKVKDGLLKAIQEEEDKAAEVLALMEMYS